MKAEDSALRGASLSLSLSLRTARLQKGEAGVAGKSSV